MVEIGEVDRAHALCEKLLSFASPLGLYGEEIDPATGRHLGNFPQAFTHLALINAVMHLIEADQRPATATPFAPRMGSDGHDSQATEGKPSDDRDRELRLP